MIPMRVLAVVILILINVPFTSAQGDKTHYHGPVLSFVHQRYMDNGQSWSNPNFSRQNQALSFGYTYYGRFGKVGVFAGVGYNRERIRLDSIIWNSTLLKGYELVINKRITVPVAMTYNIGITDRTNVSPFVGIVANTRLAHSAKEYSYCCDQENNKGGSSAEIENPLLSLWVGVNIPVTIKYEDKLAFRISYVRPIAGHSDELYDSFQNLEIGISYLFRTGKGKD